VAVLLQESRIEVVYLRERVLVDRMRMVRDSHSYTEAGSHFPTGVDLPTGFEKWFGYCSYRTIRRIEQMRLMMMLRYQERALVWGGVVAVASEIADSQGLLQLKAVDQ
jgi:hypothetical protein